METSTLAPTSFGLLAWLGKTRMHLPLTHIETRFRVTGEIATVQIDQVFEQTAREALDVTYTFPLPAQAAVHRCEMIVNGRVIRAVVMAEQEARRVVAEQKAAGHRTALVEMERGNLFTLQLGNVNPGDCIVIRFAYIEHLDRLATQLSLRIPFSPGVRYIPGKSLLRANRGSGTVDDTDQVPDASRITPPRISGDHPDAATLFMEGLLDADDVELRTLSSPTHPAILRSIAGRIEVELAGDAHLPDRDFILRWEEPTAATTIARSWACQQDGITHALLQLRAPQPMAVQVGDDFEQDVYFLLDRSGSMEGEKWQKCVEAMHAFASELGTGDRVWITCFESDFQDFDAVPLMRDVLLADAGFRALAQLGTGGGTELLPALRHVLKMRKRHSAERHARLVLITDGQVGNEPEILARMRRADAATLPLHCFGIDTAVNDAFLKSLAQQSGGRCVLMTPQDDIAEAVRRLAQTLRRPVLTHLTLEGAFETIDDRATLYDLHAGEVILLAVRTRAETSSATIRGRLADGTAWSQQIAWQSEANAIAPRLLWAHRRMGHLIATGLKKEAVQLAIAANLVCEGAAFVAWDEAEKVSVAKREVYQPALDAGEFDVCYSAAQPTACMAAMPPPAADLSCRGTPRARMAMEADDEVVVLSRDPRWLPPIALTPAQQAVLAAISARHGHNPANRDEKLPDEVFFLQSQLTGRFGMHTDLAAVLTFLLGRWLGTYLGRLARLRTFEAELAAAKNTHATLRKFIIAVLPAPEREDALVLVDLAWGKTAAPDLQATAITSP